MLKELNLGRELKEMEAVKVEGGKKKKFRIKLEVEYESEKTDSIK